MSEATNVREALPVDREALEDCVAELQAFERTIYANRVEPAALRGTYLDSLLAQCQESNGRIFVAEQAGRVVGFACILCRVVSEEIIVKDREYAYLTDLVVCEPHRRTGLGAELMHTAEAFAVSQGATRIVVGVLANNAAAHAFYRKLGYTDSEIVLEKVIDDATEWKNSI
jgi:GNAT superfamily N-acetyltransferase